MSSIGFPESDNDRITENTNKAEPSEEDFQKALEDTLAELKNFTDIAKAVLGWEDVSHYTAEQGFDDFFMSLQSLRFYLVSLNDVRAMIFGVIQGITSNEVYTNMERDLNDICLTLETSQRHEDFEDPEFRKKMARMVFFATKESVPLLLRIEIKREVLFLVGR